MGYVGLIVKATRLCNLRCAYCHDWRAERDQTMPFPVLANLVKEALSDPTHDAVEFIWHGGETTVLPMSYYERAMLVQARFRRTRQAVSNSLQTNATRITPEWARFLRANGFSVGISIDGPAAIHDTSRRTATGRPTFERVLEGMSTLRDANVPFGVLMVVTETTLEYGADAVFDFFLQLGVRSYGFNAVKPVNVPHAGPATPIDHYLTPGQMTRFLADIYDSWLRHGDRDIRIREIDAVRGRLTGGPARTCTLAGGCIGQYFLIEPNGDVAHCDLFLGDPSYSLGNICRDSFATLRSSPSMQNLMADNERALSAMRSCPNFEVCRGWCPHERYLAVRHDPMYSAGCCGLSDFVEHVRSREFTATV